MNDLTQHWRSSFDNKYLGAWNLWDAAKKTFRTVTVTIERAPLEQVTMQGGRKSQERLLYFQGKRTPLILTKKMGAIIARMFGPTPGDWIGKTITIYVERGFKTKDGPADVLRIKNERAGDAMKRQMGGGADDDDRPMPEPPEAFGDDDAPAK